MNEKLKQLDLEVSLVLAHLQLAAERSKQKVILAHKPALLSLKNSLKTLGADEASKQFNELLSECAINHKFEFLTDSNASTYILNNSLLNHIFALIVTFLCMPLKKSIFIGDLQQQQAQMFATANLPTHTSQDAMKMLQLCHEMATQVAQIIDKSETEAGRDAKFREQAILES